MSYTTIIGLIIVAFLFGCLLGIFLDNITKADILENETFVDSKGYEYEVLHENVLNEGQLEHYVVYRSLFGRRITYCCSKRDFENRFTKIKNESSRN